MTIKPTSAGVKLDPKGRISYRMPDTSPSSMFAFMVARGSMNIAFLSFLANKIFEEDPSGDFLWVMEEIIAVYGPETGKQIIRERMTSIIMSFTDQIFQRIDEEYQP